MNTVLNILHILSNLIIPTVNTIIIPFTNERSEIQGLTTYTPESGFKSSRLNFQHKPLDVQTQ